MENKFEQLLRKTLPKEEAQELEEAIENDSILKKEFEEYRDAWDLVKVLERRALKDKVSQIADNQSKPQRKQWIWYSAASVLIIVLSYLGFQQDITGEQMAQTYFEPYPDKFTTMGQNFDPLSKAMAAYNKEDYKEAENLFSLLPKELLNDIELYRGICLYKIGEKKKAKDVFRKLNRDSAGTNKGPSLWYLSITHLSLNEKDSAIMVLHKIKDDSLITFHKEDALKIIKQLK